MVLGAASALAADAVTDVSSSVFSNIQRYTAFAAASYSENCVTPPYGSSITKFFNNTDTDTQAYLFQSGSEQILSFRGSSSPKDFDTDFNYTLAALNLPGTTCGDNCFVHTGFQYALNSILPQITPYIKNPSSLTITGHSLGAGLASLAASALKPKQVYTFGEPRNGDSGYASYLANIVPDSRYFRVTHYNDGVPQIPPTALGYQHHGTEYWEMVSTGINAGNTKKCPGVEPTNCILSTDFGSNPLNGAHIQYTDMVVAAMLFNPGCGFKAPQ